MRGRKSHAQILLVDVTTYCMPYLISAHRHMDKISIGPFRKNVSGLPAHTNKKSRNALGLEASKESILER